jgi:carboxypeptidase family protein/TonB-dependent receptor-like protein
MTCLRLATCALIAGLACGEITLSGAARGLTGAPGARSVRAGVEETGVEETGAINGRVVDARTGAGLGKVLVLVEDGGPSTRTDDSGAFQLPRVDAGPRRLYVSVVGYILVRRDVRVERGATLDVTIPLSEGTGTYTETVTVMADRFRPAEPAVAAQQVLGSADIQNLRGVLADDPLRAVQVLPGVATGDDLRSEFSVRGSHFSHVNMTVDGFSTPFLLHTVRAVEDSSASGSVAMINSDVLEDVTLLNGGYAQRYGDRTGAEVDFRLREGSRERRQARIAVSGTSASLVLEGPIGGARRGSWLMSARQSYLDLVLDRLYEEGEGVNFGFSDAQAKIVFDMTPAQRAEITLIAGRSKLEERRQDLDSNDFFTGRNASGIAVGTWRYTTPRGILTSRFLASLNRFSNQTTDFVRLDEGHDVQGAGRLDASVSVAAGLQVDAGAQAEWTDETRMRQRFTQGRYRVINDFDGRATRAGGVAQLRWTAGPLTLVPGARADRWSLTGETTMSPWLQGDWKLTPSMSVRGGAGVYRQFPDFEQVIGALGQRDARAQRATQYDLGFEQRLGQSMRWQVTLYDREERGFFRRPAAETRLVLGRVVRGSTSARYQPGLDGYARGIELLVQRKSTSGISGWLSYSFGRNRYNDWQTHETYWGDLDQRHTLNFYVFYRISDRTSVSAKLRAGSNVPAPGYYTQVGSEYFLSSSRNEVRLPTYSRVDLRGNRTFNWSRKRLTLFGEIMNVLNRDNVRYNPPGINTATGRVSGLFESMIPIVPSAGILIEF